MATKQEIWETADQLLENGQKTTLAAVRKAVGGGSFTTISEAMGEWRERQDRKTKPHIEAVPTELADALLNTAQTAWSLAVEKADRDVAGLKAEIQEKAEKIAAEKQEMLELSDQLNAQIDALTVKNERMKVEYTKQFQKFTTTEGLYSELKIENARLDERLVNTRKRGDELAAQVEELQKQLSGIARQR